MTVPDVKIRGIRSPILPGHVIGRSSNTGPGDAQLIPMTDLGDHLVATGKVSGPGGSPVAVGSNPTATAGPAAVNGSALTFMRSDGAPAVQKASSSQFGIVEVDGTIITATAGVITVPKASASVFGVAKVDNTTIKATAGVISAVGGGAGGIPMLFDLTPRVPALSGFTAINVSGTSSDAENPGIALSVIDTGKNTTTLAGLTLAVPASTPYRVAICVLYTGVNAGANTYNWGWSDGTKFETYGSSANIEDWSNSTTRASFSGGAAIPNQAGIYWLGLHDDGTHRIFEFSQDGGNWMTISSATYAAGYLGAGNYKDIFIGLRPAGTAYSALGILCYDVNGLTRVVGY